ncbi:OmpA family protein [Roseospirillum parvum]|uniref:OmpA family protein n=1 Tax=Roseospirillum parvum TaxID=83401 RepID=A0A1G7UXW3_9PROT|nr:OmpA family protein [Roseospirillum parvum]SDG52445.1 OmpA family protein [Roseospirillum parvum]
MPRFPAACLTALLAVLALAGPLSSPALAADGAAEVKADVAACRPLEAPAIPLLPTGADVVSVHANAYATEPAANGAFARADTAARLVDGRDLEAQLAAYLRCDTPFMRLTHGQLARLADEIPKAAGDGRDASPVGVFLFGWSSGHDALVVRPGIDRPTDLSGATIAYPEKGRPLDLLARILSDAKAAAGGDWQPPTLLATRRASGLEGDAPAAVFMRNADVDAVFVTAPEAEVLTAGGVGTGAEGSVRGAEVLLSTRSLSRALGEVLVVRADYLKANGAQVAALVQALLDAEEEVREDVLKQLVPWDKVAAILLGSAERAAEAEALWKGVETVGLEGNKTWATASHPLSFTRLVGDTGRFLAERQMVGTVLEVTTAGWAWDDLGGDLFDTRAARISGFDTQAADAATRRMQSEGTLDDSTLLTFTINFEPNQADFPASRYAGDFRRVIDLAATYGGAVMTVEGHTDPTRYLVMKYREGQPENVLRRQRQSTLTLSLSRAQAVRRAILDFADSSGVPLDASQFVVDGRGIEDPASGLCGAPEVPACPDSFKAGDPAPPRTEEEIRANMRVVFRMVNVEAESDVLTPVVNW